MYGACVGGRNFRGAGVAVLGLDEGTMRFAGRGGLNSAKWTPAMCVIARHTTFYINNSA